MLIWKSRRFRNRVFQALQLSKGVGTQNLILSLVSKALGQLIERNPVRFGFARK